MFAPFWGEQQAVVTFVAAACIFSKGVGKWWTFSGGIGMMGGTFGKLQHQRTDPSENRWHLGCDRLRCADRVSAAGRCFSFVL